MARAPPGSYFMLGLLLCSSLFFQVLAQSTNQTTASSGTPSPTVAANVTAFLTTSSYTLTSVSHSGNIATTITTVLPTVYNATATIHANSSTPTSSASASPTPTPIVLATRITPAFGVLGAILIITGLPSAFWGHKNRWTSFFLIGFYTLSLVCFVLIVKFGILPAINTPNNTLQGMFVLASAVAGIMGGAFTIFFWKATKYFIGAWGGFAFGLWIQCFKNGGLITPVGMRWILYIVCTVVAFVLCTIPKIHWHMLLVATAFVGSSAFILGVDCYTTAGLKEFYVWNLGFTTLFPKYIDNGIAFPVTQTMEIELGLIGAIALMGGAVQLRILRILQRKLKEIAEEEKKRDEEAEINAAGKFRELSKEQEEWEQDHPPLGMHGRTASGYSGTPLMKDFPTRSSQDGRASVFTLVGGRGRYTSGVSDFMAAPAPDEDIKRVARDSQAPGALPALDLGLGIQHDVPSGFITDNDPDSSDTKHSDVKKAISLELEDLARKEELLAEIQTIRRSIDALRSDTPGPDSDDSRSRRISLTSRRTLSYDLDNAIAPRPHTRPPRQPDPRNRVQSLELSKLMDTPPLGASIGRPTSVPLRDDDWDSYVRDLPTSRVSTTGSLSAQQRLPVPSAVTEALSQRKQREILLDPSVGPDTSAKDTSDEDAPIAMLVAAHAQTKRSKSYFNSTIPAVLAPSQLPAAATRYPPVILSRNTSLIPEPERSNIPIVLPPTRPLKAAVEPSGNIPMIIPRGQSANIAAPVAKKPEPQRVATFEEMEERHREKMRGLQAPITEAEKQNAQVQAAKDRWERSKAAEREAVNRRQAEKAAEIAREEKEKVRRRSEDGLGKTGPEDDKNVERRHKGISADKLAAISGVNNPPSSKRQSVLRVEDWQRHQHDVELGIRPDRAAGAKRESRGMKAEANATVPFPGQSRPMDRRRSAGVPRDPPS
ncbi:uncharacterized protein EDB93DRAFT_1260096 [Suillus bovinus]|uniref:uncharacterized protein n=1 Tax=Suillus bovinus TaxID=48563 RepID=UPI001B8606E3|nr:uncharacterized protein EDB93DRAFT_1260096 [Suillus bovinus]KAG2159744.1 hypothetical protein EDB93DRAFT_1260096 [Suillus bovinus]